MHRLVASVVVTGVLLCVAVQPAQALVVKSGEAVTIPATEPIKETLVISGNAIVIEAPVRGDIYCAGSSVTISGPVTGDILCVGQTITVNGSVSGSLRTASQNLSIAGTIGRQVSSFGQAITLGKTGSVGGDFIAWAQSLMIHGMIMQGLHGGGEQVSITGTLRDGMDLSVGKLTLGQSASVAGALTYKSAQPAEVQNAAIAPLLTYVPMQQGKPHSRLQSKKQERPWYEQALRGMVIAFVLGALSLLFLPAVTLRGAQAVTTNPKHVILYGLATLVGVPLVLLLLFATIVGIPFSLIGAGIYVAALFLGRIVVGLGLGLALLRTQIKVEVASQRYLALGIGVAVLWTFMHLPLVGWMVSLIASVLGLGAAVLALVQNTPVSKKKARS